MKWRIGVDSLGLMKMLFWPAYKQWVIFFWWKSYLPMYLNEEFINVCWSLFLMYYWPMHVKWVHFFWWEFYLLGIVLHAMYDQCLWVNYILIGFYCMLIYYTMRSSFFLTKTSYSCWVRWKKERRMWRGKSTLNWLQSGIILKNYVDLLFKGSISLLFT